MDSVALLDRLIAFPTVSRDPNIDLIGFVRGLLADHGIEATLIGSADGRKANLFATVGSGSGGPGFGGVVLSGHTDVVPADGQAWTSDPFRMTERDGRLLGRGAADMKGFLACAIRAAVLAAGRRLRRPLHLAFSYDEELGCLGVRDMLDQLAASGLRPEFCIVGEPTGMAVMTGHKGKVAARATCCGTAAHTALAPRALNAIHLAADLVGALRRRQALLAEGVAQDAAYDVPYTTLHVASIAGGLVSNIVPDRCAVAFEVRNIAVDDARAVLRDVENDAAALVRAARARFPQAAIDFEVTNEYPGLDTAPDAPVVAFARALTGPPPDGPLSFGKVAFGTEAGLFQQRLGVAGVVCGPGSMEQGHRPDEFVTREQLGLCDRMMDALLDRLDS